MDPQKITVGRDLAPPEVDGWETWPAGWSAQSLDELGRSRFAGVMLLASAGDPYDQSTAESAESDLDDLISMAGAAFDGTGWYVLSDDHGLVGVLLPQPLPDDTTTGTLFYVGVIPERRGQGYGRAVHRLGLGLLARRGVRRYVGSTDVTNDAMAAIFTANGCSITHDPRWTESP